MEIISQLSEPHFYIQLLSLSVLLIALEIDNMVFVTLLLQKLPLAKQQSLKWEILTGMIFLRFLLLVIANYLTSLDTVLFTLLNIDLTPKSLILIGGGLFLIISSIKEIHEKLEGPPKDPIKISKKPIFHIFLEILLINLIFSLDSVITAIGTSKSFLVMFISIFIALIITFSLMRQIGYFVKKHPTFKILAFSFMLLIGILLVTEAFHHPIPKGYIYFAMFFSAVVEFINIRVRERWQPVQLYDPESQMFQDEP